MSKNINCLEGLKCPKCGYDRSIHVLSSVWVTVFDEGTEDHDCCPEYDDDSWADCPECNYHGKLREWREDKG